MFWHLRISGYSGEDGWQRLATDVDSGNADESFAAGEMLTDVLEDKSLEVQVQMKNDATRFILFFLSPASHSPELG